MDKPAAGVGQLMTWWFRGAWGVEGEGSGRLSQSFYSSRAGDWGEGVGDEVWYVKWGCFRCWRGRRGPSRGHGR